MKMDKIILLLNLRTVLIISSFFVVLCPKSTAMVMVGLSVHLTTLFYWASLNKQFTSNSS